MSDEAEPITETRDVNTDEYRIRKLEISRAVTDEKVKNLEESIDRLTTAVDALTKTMTEAKGGWRVLALQGGILMGLAALFTTILDFVRGA
jgi:hypothetical protein